MDNISSLNSPNSAAVKYSVIAVAVVSAYTSCQMLADIASLKVGSVAGLAVDMGTFIYPVTFTLRDLVHRLLGRSAARAVVISSALINLFMAAYLQICAVVPPDASWQFQSQFSAILAPVWRLVIASIAAETISELTDTEIYHKLASGGKAPWKSSLASNCISVPIDNLVFAVGAFAFTMPWSVVWEIFLSNLIIKAVVSAVSVPLVNLGHGKIIPGK